MRGARLLKSWPRAVAGGRSSDLARQFVGRVVAGVGIGSPVNVYYTAPLRLCAASLSDSRLLLAYLVIVWRVGCHVRLS